MIRIKSRTDGFRRCGIEHTEKPKYYTDDCFTKDQLQILNEEPMLTVDHMEDDEHLLSGDLIPVTDADDRDREITELKDQLTAKVEAEKIVDQRIGDLEKALQQAATKAAQDEKTIKKLEKEVTKLKKKGK